MDGFGFPRILVLLEFEEHPVLCEPAFRCWQELHEPFRCVDIGAGRSAEQPVGDRPLLGNHPRNEKVVVVFSRHCVLSWLP